MAVPDAKKSLNIRLDTIPQRDEMPCQDRTVHASALSMRDKTWHSGLNHKANILTNIHDIWQVHHQRYKTKRLITHHAHLPRVITQPCEK